MVGLGVTEDPNPAMVLVPENPTENRFHRLWCASLAVNDAGNSMHARRCQQGLSVPERGYVALGNHSTVWLLNLSAGEVA